MKRLRQSVYLWLGLVGLAVACLLPSVATAQAVVQSYSADTKLQRGMIVRLDASDDTKVVPERAVQPDKTRGIVVAPTDAPIALSGDQTKQQVYVATTGNYQVLVSNQNGDIKQDDYITVSSLAGVGMRADDKQVAVIGKALRGFDAGRDAVGSTTLTDSSGKQRTVQLGYVSLSISIARNPLQRSTTSNLPGFLQKATEAIADKPVSYTRVYLSLVILLLTAIIVGSLLYGAIKTGITSLGRNPLARTAIYSNMVRVVLVSLIVLFAGFGAVYLLLKF